MIMFQDKICIITGGANGIGRCLVEEFARLGASIAFIDKDREAGAKLFESLEGNHLFMNGNIAKQDDIDLFATKVVEKFGQVDFLIHNVCFSNKGIISGCSYEDFNEVLHVGVTAPYYLTQLLLPHFSENASIVNISSTRAYMSEPDTESYTAAKGGISALTHALAISLSGKARVNAINPGWIETGAYQENAEPYEPTESDIRQHPSNRIGNPLDIARAAIFLCDPRNDFINGEEITIDGGMSKQMIYHNSYGWEFNKSKKGLSL